MKCTKCDIEMVIENVGDLVLGDMGQLVEPTCFRCPECHRWEFNPEPSANLLAQSIDKSILDELIKDVL